MFNNNNTTYTTPTEEETAKEEKKEMTTQQKINAKIKELKKLASIDKQIATMQAKIDKLKEEKEELENKYEL